MQTAHRTNMAAATGRWAARLLFAALLAAVAALAVGRVGFGLRYEPVLTGSMSPSLPTGSLVVLAPVDAPHIRIGEVIAFRPPQPYGEPGGAPVVHRVESLSPQAGTTVLTTKGDANPLADPWQINLASGSYSERVAQLPYAEGVITFIRSLGWPSLVGIGGGVLILARTLRTLRTLHPARSAASA